MLPKNSAKKPEDVHAKHPQISRKKKLWNGLLVGAELHAVFLFRGLRFDGVCFIALPCGRSLFKKNRLAVRRKKEQ